jgi:uncharacterized protein involved in exopolysaccharide biosynthesis
MIFPNKRGVDFREIRRTLWRRRFFLAIPPLVAAASSVAGVLATAPSYESFAVLAVESPVQLTRTVEAATGTRAKGSTFAIQTIRTKIESTSFLESVAVQVGLHESPRIRAEAERLAADNPGHDLHDLVMRACVAKLQTMIEVRGEGVDLFSLRAVSSSPERAFSVAKTLTEQYIQSNRQSRLSQSDDAFQFANEQMAIYQKELDNRRAKLREFEQGLTRPGLSSSPLASAELGRVRAALSAAESDVSFLEARNASARAAVQGGRLEAFSKLEKENSSRLRALSETLFELERHLALALIESPERSPEVQGVRNQIAAQSQQLFAELEATVAASFPSVEERDQKSLIELEFARVTLEGAKHRRDGLRKFLDDYAKDLANVPAAELRLARLRADVEDAETLYETWLEQANSTQIAKAVQSASLGNAIALIEPAKLPLAPFAPRKGRIITLGVLMGVALGVGATVLIEYLDLTMKSVGEIEAVLGTPILGAVPKMQAMVLQELGVARKRRVRIWTAFAIATILALLTLSAYYFRSGSLGALPRLGGP